jgi:hypothetical protein
MTDTQHAQGTTRIPAARTAPALSGPRLAELLRLLEGAQSVELKLSVPDAGMRSAVVNLGMDPLDAELRQVCFFDTPDLALNKQGLVVRARRIQRKPGDAVVKLRPVDPGALPAGVPTPADGLGIEVDAMPGGFVCSGTVKAKVEDPRIRATWSGDRPLRKLFTKQQRAFYTAVAPDGLSIDDLSPLGPVNVLKLKFVPPELGRRMVAELWLYPDGSRILELSTKCLPPEAFDVAAQTKSYLMSHGIDLAGQQQTKTKAALNYFAKRLPPRSERGRS